MLKSIDILVGLSVVMLVVSMAVTLVNQAILNLLASRGHNLRDGLADMLELLGADMTRKEAEAIAEKTLSNPIIGGKIGSWLPSWMRSIVQFYKYGEVIHREEFVKMLLGLGASHNSLNAALTKLEDEIKTGVAAAPANITSTLDTIKAELKKTSELAGGKGLEDMIKYLGTVTTVNEQLTQCDKLKAVVSMQTAPFERLINSLKDNGIDDPAATLKNIRMLALEFEKSHPELANDVRQTNAILQEASSEFLAKINLNFDQVMDRVSVRFTSTTRVVSFFGAALVAIALQLDTVYVMNRLAMDDAMRAVFVEQAVKLSNDEAAKELAKAPKQKPENSSSEASGEDQTPLTPEEQAKKDTNTKKEKEYLMFLADQGLINLPTSLKNWCENWDNVSYPGIFLSILLLSLGAPLWYSILGKLLQLRSLLAQKDDEQKNIRQTTQAPIATSQQNPDNPTSPNPLQGEKGDLNAVG